MYTITIDQLDHDRFMQTTTDLVKRGFHFNVIIDDSGDWVIILTGGF